MSDVEILVKLRDLNQELSFINDDRDAADEVAEETIDALGQLVTDVGVLLDRVKEMKDSEKQQEERSELLQRIDSFESDHPGVKRFLSQVANVLDMMGI